MRQHPIPQNVLDVEFKLFTKFTLREFGYLALGVGSGGIFLYLTSNDMIPGIIGIPIFVVLAGLGAFFGLVPINDQPADKFVMNYFSAINKPTQRVWLNNELKDQRAKPIVQTVESKSKIIGGSKIKAIKKVIFKEEEGDDIFGSTEPISTEEEKEDEKIITIQTDTEELITISEENLSKYQFPIKSVDKLPGNINIWLSTNDNEPVENINTYLKDQEGKILYANKTGKNGYFLTNKMYPEGVYNIEFEGASLNIPPIRVVLSEDMGKLPFKITVK